MSIYSTASAATALWTTAQRVFNATANGNMPSAADAKSSLLAGRDLYRNARSTMQNSLTAYTSMTTIRSRVYIDGSISGLPVIKDLLVCLQNLYVSNILNALHLNKMITEGHSVRQLLNVVRTSVDLENYVDTIAALDAAIEEVDTISAMEAMTNKGRASIGLPPKSPNGKAPVVPDFDTHKNDAVQASLPIGQSIPITFTNPTNPQIHVKMMLNVVLAPTIIPPAIATAFITRNVGASFWKRYTQWKVGELAFWRDLVFCIDRAESQMKAAKSDKGGTFAQFLRETAQKDRDTITNLLNQAASESGSQLASKNIANTILIFSEDTVKAAKAETGIDLHKDADRNRYFTETYAMIIAIVDPFHNLVTLYLNGVPGKSQNTFDAFKPAGKKDDNDLVKLMGILAQGRVPRF